MKLELDADGMIIDAKSKARRVPVANRRLLQRLALQAERHAKQLSSGPSGGAPGAYPIPVRTSDFTGAFGVEVGDREAVLFNTMEYARALHEGFRPYGNPHATPIPARPYFDDALGMLRADKEQAQWEADLE